MAPTRDLHDPSYKHLFDHPRAVHDLLRGFIPADLVGAFDFDSLESLPTGFVSDDLRQSRGDMIWRVRFTPRRAEGGAAPREEWLYLLVMLEFQSRVDPYMAARVLAYTAQIWTRILRGGAPLEDGNLPPVLPIVHYNGRTRWSAPVEVADIVGPAGPGLAPHQPRQRYLLIDERALDLETLPADNVVSARIALDRVPVSSMVPVLSGLGRLLSGDEYVSLRRAFAAWVREAVARTRPAESHRRLMRGLSAFEQTGDLEAMGYQLTERINEYVDERIEKGVAEGIEKGIAKRVEEGVPERERTLLSRLARRKFGRETEERLTALLDREDDPERLDEIGDRVIDCETGDELLARVAGSIERR